MPNTTPPSIQGHAHVSRSKGVSSPGHEPRASHKNPLQEVMHYVSDALMPRPRVEVVYNAQEAKEIELAQVARRGRIMRNLFYLFSFLFIIMILGLFGYLRLLQSQVQMDTTPVGVLPQEIMARAGEFSANEIEPTRLVIRIDTLMRLVNKKLQMLKTEADVDMLTVGLIHAFYASVYDTAHEKRVVQVVTNACKNSPQVTYQCELYTAIRSIALYPISDKQLETVFSAALDDTFSTMGYHVT